MNPFVSSVVALLAVLVSSLPAATARADDGALCGPANAGQRTCQAGSVCECRWIEGTTRRQPPGWMWDCPLTAGKCGDAGVLVAPADLPPAHGTWGTDPWGAPYPPVVVPVDPPAAGGGPYRYHDGDREGRERIMALQRRLAGLGFDPGPIDGHMGARTQAALAAWREAMEAGTVPAPGQAVPGAGVPGAGVSGD